MLRATAVSGFCFYRNIVDARVHRSVHRAGLCQIADGDSFVAYTVAVVDVGPKPATKLAEKAKTEARLCQSATRVLYCLRGAEEPTMASCK